MLVSIILPACQDLDDDYSTNPDLRLNFSVDTLTFDTLFTTIGSATRQFMIYNRNNEALNMETIELAGQGATGFRMNVDGRKGYSFDNVGIRAKDSMFVFVEVTVNPNDNNQPLLVQDSVVFSVNGLKQRVLLEAYGQDVHLHKNGIILSTDTLLTAERPYLVYDSLVVAPNVKVRMEKGTILYMHDKANMIVYGTLSSEGEQNNPVIIRGDRLDNVLPSLPYDRTPSQWGGIYFMPPSQGNKLDYTIVRNGTTGIVCQSNAPETPQLSLTNSQITNMGGHLLTAINSNVEVINTEMTNAVGSIAALLGGKYNFIHSTLSNQMRLMGRKDTLSFDRDYKFKNTLGGQTLILSDMISADQSATLTANFSNCIIDGSYGAGSKPLSGELMLNGTGKSAFEYAFDHCVMKTKEEEGNSNLTNIIYISKSLVYRSAGNEENRYTYDFRLDSDTVPGIGKADPVVTALYPVDRYGVDRLTSPNGPTIGAYEFVPKEEEEDN